MLPLLNHTRLSALLGPSAAPATVRQVCSCGHVRSFSVGFITKGGVKYASQIDMECSNGQIIRDRAPDVGVTWQNTTAVS